VRPAAGARPADALCHHPLVGSDLALPRMEVVAAQASDALPRLQVHLVAVQAQVVVLTTIIITATIAAYEPARGDLRRPLRPD
jgi:hypothetical protein